MIIIVPRGAEAAAVRRAKPHARIVEIAPGAAAGNSLPTDLNDSEPIVVLGLCGALRDLRTGDVAVFDSVAGVRNASDDGEWRMHVYGRALRGRVNGRFVRACTSDHVVTTVAERTALAERFDADVVDMEAAPVARALAARGLGCAMVRVVSDDASRDLPAIDGVIGGDGRLRVGRLVLAFLRSPISAVAFIRNARRALRRLQAIAAAVDDPLPRDRAPRAGGKRSLGFADALPALISDAASNFAEFRVPEKQPLVTVVATFDGAYAVAGSRYSVVHLLDYSYPEARLVYYEGGDEAIATRVFDECVTRLRDFGLREGAPTHFVQEISPGRTWTWFEHEFSSADGVRVCVMRYTDSSAVDEGTTVWIGVHGRHLECVNGSPEDSLWNIILPDPSVKASCSDAHDDGSAFDSAQADDGGSSTSSE